MTLAWGIAGTGRIARDVGAVIAAHPQHRVAAVGSRELARAAGLAAALDAVGIHGSYAELVEDPAVEAVYVATPHAGHAEIVEAALTAGKAVLCEKPLTHRLADTERLAALAASTGSFLMEAMWMRFNPLIQQLARLVREGQLGEITALTAAFGFHAPYDPAGRLWDPQLGGGALLDIGIYTVDFARLLLGDPVELQAGGTLAPSRVDAESTLALTWPGGARALLHQSLLTRLPGTAQILGTAGWAEVGPSFHAPTRLLVQTGEQQQLHEQHDRNAGFIGEIEEVARCVRDGLGESAVMPLSETLATMRWLDTARRQLGA